MIKELIMDDRKFIEFCKHNPSRFGQLIQMACLDLGFDPGTVESPEAIQAIDEKVRRLWKHDDSAMSVIERVEGVA